MKLYKTGTYGRWLGVAHIFNAPNDTYENMVVIGLWFWFLEIKL